MYRNWKNLAQLGACSVPSEMISVFVIDSNVAWRDAIDTLLDQQPDIRVVGKCADISRAFSRLHVCKPDVLLIGIHRSADDEYDFVIRLRRYFPDLFIVLHGQAGQLAITNLMAAGASCLLPRGSSPKVILQTIRDARCQLDVDHPA